MYIPTVFLLSSIFWIFVTWFILFFPHILQAQIECISHLPLKNSNAIVRSLGVRRDLGNSNPIYIHLMILVKDVYY